MVRMKVEFAAPYSTIVEKGSLGDHLYIIKTGNCAIPQTEDFLQSTDIIILFEGDIFGNSFCFSYIEHSTEQD